jgi:hypothetical protein
MPLVLPLSEGLGVNAHKFAAGVRARNLPSTCLEVFDMHFNGFMNERRYFLSSVSGRNAARQVGNVSAEAVWPLFYDDKILHKWPHSFNPACFRMLFKVPGGTSTLGLPATVTVPVLES